MIFRIHVHTTPACAASADTIHELTRRREKFTAQDMTPEKRAEFAERGFTQTPIVEVEFRGPGEPWRHIKTWQGHRSALIAEFTDGRAPEASAA